MRKTIASFLLIFFSLSFSFADVSACFEEASRRFGVPLELLVAIAYVESKFNPNAINYNRDGSVDVGIMQVNSSNFFLLRREGIVEEPEDLWNPCKNVMGGAYILRLCLDRFGLTWRAVDCYNKGPSRAKSYGRYVIRVYETLRRLLE